MLIYLSQSVPTYISSTEEQVAALAILQQLLSFSWRLQMAEGTHDPFEKLITVVLPLSFLQSNSFRVAVKNMNYHFSSENF